MMTYRSDIVRNFFKSKLGTSYLLLFEVFSRQKIIAWSSQVTFAHYELKNENQKFFCLFRTHILLWMLCEDPFFTHRFDRGLILFFCCLFLQLLAKNKELLYFIRRKLLFVLLLSDLGFSFRVTVLKESTNDQLL